jgi:hypothetical protein
LNVPYDNWFVSDAEVMDCDGGLKEYQSTVQWPLQVSFQQPTERFQKVVLRPCRLCAYLAGEVPPDVDGHGAGNVALGHLLRHLLDASLQADRVGHQVGHHGPFRPVVRLS